MLVEYITPTLQQGLHSKIYKTGA